jgi:hypothetical protein
MKGYSFVMFIVISLGFLSHAQVQERNPFIEFSQTNFSIGSTYGVHPNYTGVINASYFQGEFDSRIKIASVPIYVIGRVSDEKYRSGRPSFFRISYDATTQRKIRLGDVNDSLLSIHNELNLKQQKIYELEAKLSYLKQKQIELDNSLKIESELPFINIDSLSINGSLPPSSVPNYELSQMNLIEISSLEKKMQLETIEYDKIKQKKLEVEKLHNQLSYKKSLGFLDGIKKIDLGLSSLSNGGLSKNAIPMQGIHVAGVINRFFYDAAAGFTMPNQLFSTSAFDQVINNSSNVFNLGNFFNIESVRFVGSGIFGFGEKDKKAISIENYYTGKTLEQIRGKENGLRSLTSNLNSCYTLIKFPTVTVNGVVGYSNYFNDTVQRNETDKLAYGGGVVIGIKRISSLFKANYRSLGSSYDGFTQGIYINGADHFDASLKKEIGRRIILNSRYAFDKFHSDDTIVSLSQAHLGGLDINWKLGFRTSIYGSYTLVSTTNAESKQNLSYLSRAGIYSIQRIKHIDWVNSADAGYARVSGVDSNQVLTQGTLKSEFRFEKWYFSAKATYQNVIGLARVYGENWIFQPEIGIKLLDFEAGLSFQFLKSQQFGSNNGLQGYFTYRPSPFISWTFSATKWLPSEYIFFLPEMTSYQRPYYFKVKLSIHLNVKK